MSRLMRADSSTAHPVAAIWGATGVIGIVLYAVVRLADHVFAALSMGLDVVQWSALVCNIVFMAWSEGYRGFQLKFAPRVAARAVYLWRTPVSVATRLAAPLFCIGYFAAHRRTRVIAWAGTAGIVVLVLIVHRLDQPWRGVIDAGVVVGLSWGLVSLCAAVTVALRTLEYPVSPQVPDRYNGD